MTAKQVQDAWLNALSGETITLDSDIGRLTLKPSNRAKKSLSVIIDCGSFTISRSPEVGSSDTLLLSNGLRDLIVNGGNFLACSRAGIKTVAPLGARNVYLRSCLFFGGFDAHILGSKTDTKWGGHHYFTGAWAEDACEYTGIYQEHARYFHQSAGNHTFYGCKIKHCGRTALQVVNRMAEAGDPQPAGYGDWSVSHEDVEDVCLEQGGGGSAYTFRGGMPNSIVSMVHNRVRLGCNALLARDFHGRATGAFVMDSAPESAPGAGDGAHPGGTNELHFQDEDYEVGSVYPGAGSAKRPCVKVGAVNRCTWNGGRIKVPVGDTALEIKASCLSFKWTGSPAISGKVNYRAESFNSWDAFVNAHPECRA